MLRLFCRIVAAGVSLAACDFAAAHDYSAQVIAESVRRGGTETTVQRTPARRVRWSEEDTLTDAVGFQAEIVRDISLEEWVFVGEGRNLHSDVIFGGWSFAHELTHCAAPFNAGSWFSTERRNVGNLERVTVRLRCFGLLPLTATAYHPFDFCPEGESFLGTGSIPADHQFANFRYRDSSCFRGCEFTTTDRICLPERFVGMQQSRPRTFRLQVAPRRALSVQVKILP